MTIAELVKLKESEDKIEFKEAKTHFPYNGGTHKEQKDRRKCFLGYVVALANEEGGYLVLGMNDNYPHKVVGSNFSEGKIGALEDDVYNKLGIRVHITELFDENGLRVVVTKIPSRPIGKTLKFEGVPLMRIGDSLRNMSDDEVYRILSEQEPDFSQKICQGVTIDDLDDRAIEIMKSSYARKQNNSQFLTLTKEQVLNDLDLIDGDKVTNAAVILVGKEKTIKTKLPQASINLEYRKNEGQITFDKRYFFTNAYFLEIEKLWNTIDLRNGSIPIQEGPFIFNIPYFNKEVIREAINNAVAHRNYRLTSEIVIKQYDSLLDIISPGGFPIGVTLKNLISTSSTPRNRLLTEVLQKTGIVERSGQGIDKIYYQTLKEGKQSPDYTKSDSYQVELHLSAIIEDKAFALFIESIQAELDDNKKLSVQEVICLNQIKKDSKNYDKKIISKLLHRNLIEKRGKTRAIYYVLSKAYYEFSGEKGVYSKKIELNKEQAFLIILEHFNQFEKAKMQDFIDLFNGRLNRKQVRNIVAKLVETGKLKQDGIGKGTFYIVGDNHLKNMKIIRKALEIGMKELEKNGDI